MPRRSAYRICLPNFCGAGGDLARDAAGAQRGGDGVAGAARLLVDERDEDGAGHRPAAGEHAVGEQRDQRPGDAERDADAGVRRPAVAGERVVAAAGADRLQPLVAGHEDLEDRAGVVVEAAGDAQVGLDRDVLGRRGGAALDDGGELGEALVEQLVLDAERADLLDERGVGDPDRRQRQAALRPARRSRRRRSTSSSATVVGRQLVELVDDADRGGDVGHAEAAVEALDQLAVVELEAAAGGIGSASSASTITRITSTSWWNGSLSRADDVDVGLGELAVAALLRPLAAPRRLDLVAPERELELAGVLEHVAGERHGEVEVQPEPGVAVVGRRPAAGAGRRPPCRSRRPCAQPVERLDDPGLDVGEAVQLEGARQRRRSPRARRRAAAGSSSGNPLSGVGLAIRQSPRVTRRRSPLALEVEQERVGRALPADGGLLAVAGQHHDVVGERQHLARPGCAASSGGRRRAGRCGRSTRRRAGRRRTSPRRRPAGRTASGR